MLPGRNAPDATSLTSWDIPEDIPPPSDEFHDFPADNEDWVNYELHGHQEEVDEGQEELITPEQQDFLEDFDDDEKIKQHYYDEVIATIKRLTGASRVVIFDHSG